MSEAPKEVSLRLIPDKPGRGGTKTGLTTHLASLDVRQATNVYLYNSRWRAMPDDASISGTFPDGTVGTVGRSVHAYNSYSLTDPSVSATRVFLGHHKAGATDYVWNYQTGSVVQYAINGGANQNLADTSGKAVPMKFLNVRNRCFMSWGVLNAPYTTNVIYDGSLNLAYDVGCPAPTAAMTYTIAPGFTGTATVTNGAAYITYNAGAPAWGALSVVAGSTQVQVGGGTYVIGGALVTAFAAPGAITTTAGSAVASVNTNWPIDGSYNGLTVSVGGNSAVVGSYAVAGGTTTIYFRSNFVANNVGAGYSVTGASFPLTSAYNGTTAWSVSCSIFTNPLSWTTKGPQYAYARYNPTTGHISNVSPILSVTEQNQSGVSTTLSNIVRDGSTSAIYKAGYTQLLVFRTFLSGGSVLYSIGDPTAGGAGLISNTPAGATTFVDTSNDSQLLPAFQAPLVSNRQPPAFAHMEFWDGKLWGSPVNDPTGIYYSADLSQVPFGVAEESYPSTNILRIPAQDGRVLGMLLVGNMLVVTTERYAYYVVGNSSANYRLLRYSTTMNGVSDYQMIEFAGEGTSDNDRVVYVGSDKKLYVYSLGGNNVAISLPVQDQFDANANLSTVRLQQVVTPGFRWVAVAPSGGTSPYVLAFDYENQVWLNIALSHRPQAFCASYIAASTPLFVYTYNGALYRWCDTTVSTRPATASSILTPPLPFGDMDHLKSWSSIRAFVSNNPNGDPWTATIIPDEKSTTYAVQMDEQPDPIRSPQPGGANTQDSATAVEVVAFSPQVNDPPVPGHRFIFSLAWPASTYAAPLDLYAVDLTVVDDDAGVQADLT